MFWTIPIVPGAFTADPSTGRARYSVHNLEIPDYGSGFNAFANGPTVPGKVSFDIRFFPDGDSQRYAYDSRGDPTDLDDFVVDYWQTQATIEWVGETEGGFRFESYRVGKYPDGREPGQFFAVVGTERNGVFARSDP